MNEPESLEPLVADVDGVYCVTDFYEAGYDGEVAQGKNMTEVADNAGIEYFVFSSVGGAERDTGIPHSTRSTRSSAWMRSSISRRRLSDRSSSCRISRACVKTSLTDVSQWGLNHVFLPVG